MNEYLPIELRRAIAMAKKRGLFDEEKDDVKVWKNSFVGRFLTRWPNAGKTIDVFTSVLGHVPEWSDITDANLRDLRDALGNGRCPSSVKTLCSQVKAIINANTYDVHKDKDPLAICDMGNSLKVKRSASQAVYLTQKELERLHKVVPKNPAEAYVKRVFMVGALTGARHTDAERLSLKHVNTEKNTLTYRARKTGKPVTVPVHRWLPEYLDHDGVQEVGRLASFNDILRSLCYRAEIRDIVTLTRRGQEQQGPKFRFVASHTARRTFATLLFLHGSSIPIIARLMGHSDPQLTWRNYICAESKYDDHTLQFFN